MIVSNTKKFIFIHIPKNAGTSVRRALGSHATVPVWQHQNSSLPVQTNPDFSKHAKAIELRKYFTDVEWNSYFKFAFVRNPWDWFVSIYCYIRMDKTDPRHFLATHKSFEEFLEWFTICDASLYPAKLGQLSYLVDQNQAKIVDYIGRVESMTTDFAQICMLINAPVHLPRLNTTNHAAYRQFYNENSKKIIASLFHTDIQEFGYKF